LWQVGEARLRVEPGISIVDIIDIVDIVGIVGVVDIISIIATISVVRDRERVWVELGVLVGQDESFAQDQGPH